MICCIDSNTFIWGIKRQASKGQEDMIPRAEHLFEWLDNNGHQILIPAVVIAEVLAPEPLEKYPVLIEKIKKSCIVADFDIKAASRYGNLFMNKIEELKKTAKDNKIDLQKMKVDHLIVATALANGASCIYSHDNGIKIFGQRHIDVRDLPLLPATQPELFK
jgi:predicted nucleic acid-binding protein